MKNKGGWIFLWLDIVITAVLVGLKLIFQTFDQFIMWKDLEKVPCASEEDICLNNIEWCHLAKREIDALIFLAMSLT